MKIALFCFLFTVCFLPVSSQYRFQKKHVYTNIVDEYNAIVQTSDSGYAVAGSPGATNNDADLVLTRMNKLGDTLWTRTFGSPTIGNQESCWARSLVQADDDGFFIAGYTEGFGSTNFNYYLVRTNPLGDTLWTRTLSYPNSGHDYAYSCLQTSDGNFVAFGRQGVFNVDFYLSKWDDTGSLLWNKKYDLGSNHDFGNSVDETSDGGFIMGGYTNANGATPEILVVRTDSTGTLQWAKKFASASDNQCNSVMQTSDGGYVIAGTSQYNIFVIKLNSTGDTSWSRIYGNTAVEYGMKIREIPGNGYIITGEAFNTSISQSQMCLVRIDPSGNIMWSNTYGSSSVNSEGMDVSLAIDGGFIACGHIFDSPRGGYIVKTDAAGISGCNQSPLILNSSATSFQVSTVTPTVSASAQVGYPPSIVGSGLSETLYCFSTGLDDEISNRNIFTIYPNPAFDQVTVQYEGNSENVTLNIYSLMGALVHESKILPGDTKIDILSLEPGLYIAEIKSLTGSSNKKFAVASMFNN